MTGILNRLGHETITKHQNSRADVDLQKTLSLSVHHKKKEKRNSVRDVFATPTAEARPPSDSRAAETPPSRSFRPGAEGGRGDNEDTKMHETLTRALRDSRGKWAAGAAAGDSASPPADSHEPAIT